MSKEWFIKDGGQVCFKSENCELNGWDTQSLVDCLNGKEQKISDLEAKLAESEERINWLAEAEFNRKWAKKYVEMRRKEDPMLCLPDSDEVYEKYFELKQQLAEKDKEIKNLTLAYFESETNKPVLTTTQIINQDKISFAVEQLEKVKKQLEERIKIIEENEREGFCDRKQGLDMWQENKNAIKIIDNQIKQLKEQVK